MYASVYLLTVLLSEEGTDEDPAHPGAMSSQVKVPVEPLGLTAFLRPLGVILLGSCLYDFCVRSFQTFSELFFLSFCFPQTRSGYQPELYSVGLEKPDWVQGWTGLVLGTRVGPGELDLTWKLDWVQVWLILKPDWVRLILDWVQDEATGKENFVLRLVDFTKDSLELQGPQWRTFNLDELLHLPGVLEKKEVSAKHSLQRVEGELLFQLHLTRMKSTGSTLEAKLRFLEKLREGGKGWDSYPSQSW